MSTQTPPPQELKDLPFATTKGKLVEMYCTQMPRDFIIKEINLIMIANRRLIQGCRPKASKVTHKEFTEFIVLHGAPKGYKVPPDIFK